MKNLHLRFKAVQTTKSQPAKTFINALKRVAVLSSMTDLILGMVALSDVRILPIALAWSFLTLIIVIYGYLKYNSGIFTKGNITLGIAGVIVTAIAYGAEVFAAQFEGMAVGVSLVKTIRLVANAMNKTMQFTKLKDMRELVKQVKGEHKLKNFIKWIFKSNPKTVAMLISLLIAAVSAIEAYVDGLALGILAPIVAAIFTAIGGYLAATRTGFETNEEADARKQEEAKKIINDNTDTPEKAEEKDGKESTFAFN